MAIQPVNAGNAPASVSQTKSTTKSTVDTKSATPGSISGEDTVVLTNGINNPSNLDSSTPIVDDRRVTNIKAALQSGDYQISPERTAKKLMQLDLKLPNTT
ncbi:MAG: flagellar biosynthesis anti-sigma factor FlgM [Methylomonas sp.]|nr:flagellar biosynthesis anti-sigma factor FlgM [Methylomonas sp.]